MDAAQETPRALALRQRMDRLGLPDRAFARRAGVNRSTIAKALKGHSRSATYGKLERVLDDLERDANGGDPLPPPSEKVADVELPDGTKVRFKGMTPEEAARAARVFLDGEGPSEGVS